MLLLETAVFWLIYTNHKKFSKSRAGKVLIVIQAIALTICRTDSHPLSFLELQSGSFCSFAHLPQPLP